MSDGSGALASIQGVATATSTAAWIKNVWRALILKALAAGCQVYPCSAESDRAPFPHHTEAAALSTNPSRRRPWKGAPIEGTARAGV